MSRRCTQDVGPPYLADRTLKILHWPSFIARPFGALVFRCRGLDCSRPTALRQADQVQMSFAVVTSLRMMAHSVPEETRQAYPALHEIPMVELSASEVYHCSVADPYRLEAVWTSL